MNASLRELLSLAGVICTFVLSLGFSAMLLVIVARWLGLE